MTERTIEARHRTKTGKVSDKWAAYLPYDDALFGPLRESLKFRNAIITIKKALKSGHDKLGERGTAGSLSAVRT
ncbi:MAG: hypothetical protein LH481_09500 [Burkholderiales bacterium]|nr:hypothetical protein [Burkholderiales bacterium]